ncbi:MAG: hypothetical protein AAF725_26440, partial [Acidobacteriota bacterium]
MIRGRWILLAACLLGLAAGGGGDLLARPGGGDSFGGPSGGSGGGGGGDLGILFLILELYIRFVIAFPSLGVPATLVLIGAVYWWNKGRRAHLEHAWDVGGSRWDHVEVPILRQSADLEEIRRDDENFSAVLFEDFAYSLYAKAHEASVSESALEALAPYLAPGVRQHLAALAGGALEVTQVVVGALRVEFVSRPRGAVKVGLEFESNLTEVSASGRRRIYLRERWRLSRPAGVKSRPPEKARDLSCPSCGSAYRPTPERRCASCGQAVEAGDFDWRVEEIVRVAHEDRPPELR